MDRNICLIVVSVILLVTLTGMAQEEQVYPFRDFSGGMAPDIDGIDMELKYGYWGLNFDVTKSRLETRQGYTEEMDVGDIASGNSIIIDAFQYHISSPNIEGLYEIVPEGTITVVHGLLFPNPANDSTNAVETFYMYPKYTAGSEPGEGTWSDEWSGNLNDSTNAPVGRSDQLRSSGLKDYVVYANALHMSAGAQSGVDINGNTQYTYPWWFGHIGRYMWQGYRHLVDDFALYETSCFVPDTSEIEIDSLYVEGSAGNYPHTVGRYYFKICYEYDGFQYSAPIGDSTWFTEVTGTENHIICRLTVDTTAISDRVTAIMLFGSNPVGEGEIYFEGGAPETEEEIELYHQELWEGRYKTRLIGTKDVDWGTLQFYFRKRIIIAAADTSVLGVKSSRVSGSRALWNRSSAFGKNGYLSCYLYTEDYDATMPNMWDYINQYSNENIILPEYMAVIGDRVLAGNILIDSPTSKVNERYRNFIIISPWRQPDVFPINDEIPVGANRGSYITGIKEWNGNALIWTNDAFEIWSIDESPFRLEQFVEMGCTVPRSIQITPYGVFWANYDGAYQYTSSGIPQIITPLIESVYDSFAVAINDTTWYGGVGVNTLPFSESFYLADKQCYALAVDSIYASQSDTSITSTYYVWGDFASPRVYGGRIALVYNIPYQSWVKWDYYGKHFRRFFKGTNGKILGLHMSYFSEKIYQINFGSTTSNDVLYWSSGWTDLGYLNIEKELTGVELDFEAGFTLDAFDADTITVTVYVDGKTDAYETFYFYATDSTMSPVNTRRVQYQKASNKGGKIDDPYYREPMYFDFHISYDDVNKSGGSIVINTLTPRYLVKDRRK